MKIFFRIGFGAVMWLMVSAAVSQAQGTWIASEADWGVWQQRISPCLQAAGFYGCASIWLPDLNDSPRSCLPYLEGRVADEMAAPGDLLFRLTTEWCPFESISSSKVYVPNDSFSQVLSDSEETRLLAVYKLGRQRAKSELDALIRCLRQDASAKVRLAAVKALARIASVRALPALRHAACQDSDMDVARFAEFAADIIGDNLSTVPTSGSSGP